MHTLMEGLSDADGIGCEVKVIQGECHYFAESHPRIEEQIQGCPGPYVLYVLDKAVILVECPEDRSDACVFSCGQL